MRQCISEKTQSCAGLCATLLPSIHEQGHPPAFLSQWRQLHEIPKQHDDRDATEALRLFREGGCIYAGMLTATR